MRTKTYDRLAVMGVTLFLFIGIFIAKDRFNFLSYTSNPVLSAIRENTVQEIGLDDGKQASQIIQKNGLWYVKKDGLLYKADQDRVKVLLESILNLKKEEIVTTKKADQANYGIGAQKITVISPDHTFALYIGNNANLSRNYARIDEENEVFLTEGFSDVFVPIDYRDLSIGLVNDESNVDELVLKGDETIKLSSTDNEWFIGDRKVNKEEVSFYINDLKTLKAEDIVENAQNLDSPEFTVQIMEKDQLKEAKFYNQGNYYLVEVSNNLYKIRSSDIEPLKKTEADFLQ